MVAATLPRVHPTVGTLLTGTSLDDRVPNVSGQVKDFSPVPANLIAEMERARVTNTELARALGVSERQITRWRGGVTPRSYGLVSRMARYFGRSPEWFYTDHNTETVAA